MRDRNVSILYDHCYACPLSTVSEIRLTLNFMQQTVTLPHLQALSPGRSCVLCRTSPPSPKSDRKRERAIAGATVGLLSRIALRTQADELKHYCTPANSRNNRKV